MESTKFMQYVQQVLENHLGSLLPESEGTDYNIDQLTLEQGNKALVQKRYSATAINYQEDGASLDYGNEIEWGVTRKYEILGLTPDPISPLTRLSLREATGFIGYIQLTVFGVGHITIKTADFDRVTTVTGKTQIKPSQKLEDALRLLLENVKPYEPLV